MNFAALQGRRCSGAARHAHLRRGALPALVRVHAVPEQHQDASAPGPSHLSHHVAPAAPLPLEPESAPLRISRRIAAARAVESHRHQAGSGSSSSSDSAGSSSSSEAPLFVDPYAELLAAGRAPAGSSLAQVAADLIATAYTDELLLRAVGLTAVNGISDGDYRQVVLLGDALDSRPYRLPWPPGTALYLVAPREAHAAAEAALASEAAAAIAAAVAAVDSHDILTAPAETLLPPAPFAAPAAAAPAASGTAGGVAPLPQPPIVFGTSGAVEEQAEAEAGAAAAGAGGETSLDPIERPKASPTDPPPDLVIGDDDIFWMSKLHAGLEEKGFHPGDFDMENWVYGETTLNAVLTFQASERLPETGVVDRPTWTALLGAEAADELYARAAASAATAATSATTSSSGSSSGSSSSSASGSSSNGGSSASGSSSCGSGRVSTKPAGAPLTRWPVLMEGDGGREVHALQVALTNCGFYTGEDDMRWWQFGDTTLTALKFYQSCNGLPESGVCDERSWRSLLAQCAPEAEDPQPNDIYGLRLARGPGGSDDEDNFEEDMEGVSNGRVWLLGEQRWEKRS